MTHGIVTEWVSADGMPAYLARPAVPGDHPGVVVGSEIFGVTGYIRRMTERLAGLGYVAIAPDFYHRTSPRVELEADAQGRERGLELAHGLDRDGALDDIHAAIGHLREHHGAPGRIGMVGFSLGGHLAFLAAARLPLHAVAAFYPGWLTTGDIPLSSPEPTLDLAPGIAANDCRVLLLLGEDDHLVDAGRRELIADRLKAEGVRHELVVYPGARHGFACDERETFDEAATADAWKRLRELL